MKRLTVSIDHETYEKLSELAKKKNWSLSKTMEHILRKIVKKPNAKESNS